MERGAELILTARPDCEDDEVTCKGQRCLPSEILLNERKCKVNSGGHSGRRPDVSVPDEYWIGIDTSLRVVARQITAIPPMRHRSAAIEKPRRT